MPSRSGIVLLLILSISWISCCTGSRDGESFTSKIRYRQYYNNGKKLYLNNCSNCHQEDGTGLARLYPPLSESDYFKADPGRTVCIIRHGQQGEIDVNGISFNQPMPANPGLTGLELAELMTYLYGTWGDEPTLFTIEDISGLSGKCDQEHSRIHNSAD